MGETEILKIKGDWEEVVNDCRATVKKPPLGKEPSTDFKRRILMAEHSPIRDITVKFRWNYIPYWVAMHWKTHHWESRVNSQRNDRQKEYDRNQAPQDVPVNFIGDANVQSLIDTWRKRLCRQAAPETRRYAEDFKETLYEQEPEIASVLVPNCVYRGFCPEMYPCGWWDTFATRLCREDLLDGQKRYAKYNEWFAEQRKHKYEI